MKWVGQLLSKASRILENYISEISDSTKRGSFLTPPSRKGKRAGVKSKLLSEAVAAVYTVGSLVIVCPSADMSAITPLLHTIITSGNSDQKWNKLPGTTVSLEQTAPSLYIQAWLTMGKICLADGNLAKKYIPLFVRVWLLTYHHCFSMVLNNFLENCSRCGCDKILWISEKHILT